MPMLQVMCRLNTMRMKQFFLLIVSGKGSRLTEQNWLNVLSFIWGVINNVTLLLHQIHILNFTNRN